jgi:hypothetical protein
MIRPVFGNITTSLEPEIAGPGMEATYRVFPNPATGSCPVDHSEVNRVQVYDLMGRELKAVRYAQAAESLLDLSGMPDGIYVLHLHTPRKVTSGRWC